MQVVAMKYIGRKAAFSVPVICGSYVVSRHFWKNPTKTANTVSEQPLIKKSGSIFDKIIFKKDVFSNTAKVEELQKEKMKSRTISSIFSGNLWTSYAEKEEKEPVRAVDIEMKRGESASGDLWSNLYDIDYYLSKIPDKFMDNRIKESLQDLAKLAEGVYNKVGKEPVHPIILNIALLRLFAIETHEKNALIDEDEDKAVRAEISDEFSAETVHFFKFAEDVYELDPAIIRQDIVLNQLEEKESMHIPRHIVFLDHITRSIVVAIRGTASLSDMITDLYIEASPFLDPSKEVYAHKGIAESAEAMLPAITATINKIKAKDRGKYEKYRVITTGHSLGAGSAALLAVLLSTESKIPVTCFAFAPPPIISQPDINKPRFPFEFMNSAAPCVIHSFVHDRDFIARCSHRELIDMLSALSAIDSLGWTDYERSTAVFRQTLTDAEKQEIRDVLRSERKRVADDKDIALYIPGQIYLIRPVISVEVTTSEPIPEPVHEREASANEQPKADAFTAAWQRVKRSVSENGSGVISSSISATKPVGTTEHAGSSQPTGKDPSKTVGEKEKEKETERQKEKLRLERLQYEIIAVPSAGALFNGLLYYGDSMVNDHLITSYRRALLRMIK